VSGQKIWYFERVSILDTVPGRCKAKTLFIKIPFVYLMVCIGCLFDFVVGLPFLVICEIGNFFRRD
jgi:hypothetical protein